MEASLELMSVCREVVESAIDLAGDSDTSTVLKMVCSTDSMVDPMEELMAYSLVGSRLEKWMVSNSAVSSVDYSVDESVYRSVGWMGDLMDVEKVDSSGHWWVEMSVVARVALLAEHSVVWSVDAMVVQ